jgi:hypothetical protein
MPTAHDFLAFFSLLFKSLVKLGDTGDYKSFADTLSFAEKRARARYQAALAAKAPTTGAGGGFRAKSAGGTGDPIFPPRTPDTVPSGGEPRPRKYTDGIDYQVRSSWIAAFNFRPLSGGKGGLVQQFKGNAFPSKLPSNTGDLTMITTRASYANPSGRYTYPNVPRAIMDRAVDTSSAGKYYWGVLRYYSNRSLIGRRMRRTSRRLRSS